MSDLNKILRRKAFGIMSSIEKMIESGMQNVLPSESFGENYNKLRNAVLAENPNLEGLLPPEAIIRTYGYEGSAGRKTSQLYSELHTFCSEIYHLLEE